ncbi:hypothetical protein D3C81_2020760 [compost metagenome]
MQQQLGLIVRRRVGHEAGREHAFEDGPGQPGRLLGPLAVDEVQRAPFLAHDLKARTREQAQIPQRAGQQQNGRLEPRPSRGEGGGPIPAERPLLVAFDVRI